jgi:hypothetical protein
VDFLSCISPLFKIEPTATPFFPFPTALEVARLDVFVVEAETVVDDIFQKSIYNQYESKTKLG